MTGKVGELGEKSLSSYQRPQQPCLGCSLAYGGGEGSEAAEGGGYDGGGDESCSQQEGDQHDRCDHSEGVELPISVPAETLVEAHHPGGCSYAADFLSPPSAAAAAGGDASSHPAQGSCCSCSGHSCSDEGGGHHPGSQPECQLEVESGWMSQRWSWAAEWVPIHPLACGVEGCRSWALWPHHHPPMLASA